MIFLNYLLSKIKNIFNNKDVDVVFHESDSMEKLFDGMSLEESDNISQFVEIEGRQVHFNELAGQLEQIPAGIVIPGLGHFGSNQQQAPSPKPVLNNSVDFVDVGNASDISGAKNKSKKMVVETTVVNNKMPYYEMAELNSVYYLYIDMPAVTNLKLSIVDGREVVITGSRESMIANLKNSKSVKKCSNEFKNIPEFMMNKFTFKFPVKNQIDTKSISTSYENGLLSVVLPQLQSSDTVEIAIM